MFTTHSGDSRAVWYDVWYANVRYAACGAHERLAGRSRAAAGTAGAASSRPSFDKDKEDDLLKRDVDTIDWHQYIKNYIAKGDPVFFCTFAAEDCENVD